MRKDDYSEGYFEGFYLDDNGEYVEESDYFDDLEDFEDEYDTYPQEDYYPQYDPFEDDIDGEF